MSAQLHPVFVKLLNDFSMMPPAPVQVLTCHVCQGSGYVERPDGISQVCTTCGGRGRIATEGGEV